MTNGAALISNLQAVNQHTMLEMVEQLDKLTITELHNVISKTQVIRALVSMALQERKFPISG